MKEIFFTTHGVETLTVQWKIVHVLTGVNNKLSYNNIFACIIIAMASFNSILVKISKCENIREIVYDAVSTFWWYSYI